MPAPEPGGRHTAQRGGATEISSAALRLVLSVVLLCASSAVVTGHEASDDPATARNPQTEHLPAATQSTPELSSHLLQLVRSARTDAVQGRLPAAEQKLRSAWQTARELPRENVLAVVVLNNLGHVLCDRGQLAEAETLLREAILRWKGARPGEELQVTLIEHNLVKVFLAGARYEEAIRLARRSLAVRDKHSAGEDIDAARLMAALACAYDRVRRFSDAEAYMLRALSILERELGPGEAETVRVLSNLAGLKLSLGQHAEAEALSRRALDQMRRAVGPEHPALAAALNNLACALMARKNYAEAQWALQSAINVLEPQVVRSHPDMILSQYHLAHLYALSGRYKESAALYVATLNESETSLGTGHAVSAQILAGYAEVLRKLKRKADARAMETRARAAAQRAGLSQERHWIDVRDPRISSSR